MKARLEIKAVNNGEKTRSQIDIMGKNNDLVEILCVIYKKVPAFLELIKMSLTSYNEVLDNLSENEDFDK